MSGPNLSRALSIGLEMGRCFLGQSNIGSGEMHANKEIS